MDVKYFVQSLTKRTAYDRYLESWRILYKILRMTCAVSHTDLTQTVFKQMLKFLYQIYLCLIIFVANLNSLLILLNKLCTNKDLAVQ
jgi:hypothetical protein